MPPDAHEVLSATLASLTKAGPPKRVYTAHTQLRAPNGSQQFPLPRIMMPISGSHQFTFSTALNKQTEIINVKEAIFTAPMAWTKTKHQAHARIFALVCHHGFTRFLVFDTNEKGIAIESSKFWIHSKQDTSTALRSSLLAMHNTAKRRDCTDTDSCLRHQLLSCLLLAHEDLLNNNQHEQDELHAQWRQACAWIDEHSHDDIGRDDLARLLGVHPNHVARIFRHNNDHFPQRLEQARMNRAYTLLSQSESSINEIASSSGFQSTSYFIRRFKLLHGMTPKEWRLLHASD